MTCFRHFTRRWLFRYHSQTRDTSINTCSIFNFSEREFNLLTNEAKKLSYDHHIVSPVVSFLVRKPKSSLNLIDNRLQGDSAERERRSEKVQETHEIRYQYRKLWWRTNQQDGLESAKDELDQIKGKSKKSENLESKNFWLGLGSAPLMVSFRSYLVWI